MSQGSIQVSIPNKRGTETGAQAHEEFMGNQARQYELRQRSVRGGLTTLSGAGVSFLLRIGSTLILARLLMPEHFGLVGMVIAVTGFAKVFKDFGLYNVTIQHKTLSHTKVSTLFWVNVTLGLLLTLSLALFSPIIALFYSEPRLTQISLVLSFCFFFYGLTSQHQALLHRQMRFQSLAAVKIFSIGAGSAIAIALAWKGFGHWALVWKEVATAAFGAAGAWLMCRWIPGMPKFESGVGSMFSFGRDVTVFNIVSYLASNADKILIGRLWGAGPLGLYAKAYQVMLGPLNQLFRFPLEDVAEPGLSALQDDAQRYCRYYKKFVSILAFFCMPLAVYVCVYSEALIGFFLGEKWLQAAVLLRMFALAGLVQPIMSTAWVVLVTTARTKRLFFWGLGSAILTVAAFGIGVNWGPEGVATAYALANYILFIPSFWYCFQDTPLSVSLVFQAIWLPLSASLLMGVLLIALAHQMTEWGHLPQIILSLFVAAISYSGLWLLAPGGKEQLVEYASYPLSMIRRSSQ